MTVYLDTHVVVWLYAGAVELLSDRARELVEGSDLLVSPMVLLELEYLCETGRTTECGDAVVEQLGRTIGLETCDAGFRHVARLAATMRWTRDPFDRIIVAQAMCRESLLLSKDRAIRDNYSKAVW
jgi:PIN domain nuclease of toxin-antitoxin system